MTSWRDQILGNLERGDLIFALSESGQGMIMLVREVDSTTIRTRHVPSQLKVDFNRDTRSGLAEDLGVCTILSAAPLPVETYNVVFGLDRKVRLMHALDHLRLTDDEVGLLGEVENFYRSRPLPEE